MTMTPQELSAQEPTLELINSELESRLARQSDVGSKIDTKAVFLVGFAATAAQFLASRSAQPLLAGAAFVAYAVAIGFGVAVFHLADYEDIEPRQVLEHHARSTKGETLVQLAATRVGMFEKNSAAHRRKARRWTISLTALVAGIALSTAAILLHTDGHDRRREPGKPVPSSSVPSRSVSSSAPAQHH
ncbi:hypothetical protein [Streptomyces sp. NPDC002889]|uniref:hypothetical protein n=1 Tax=Streptomyces sp. NPDC002889 TaxID=3364669 RepID=UPI003682C09A